MTIEDQIRDEKLQYDINRESAKISALSSGKTDKYEYLTGEEILLSNQQQIIEPVVIYRSSGTIGLGLRTIITKTTLKNNLVKKNNTFKIN